MKLKYMDIFIIPLIIVALMSIGLFYNHKSIKDREETIDGLPSAEELANNIINSNSDITKDSILIFASQIKNLSRKTLKDSLGSMKTYRDIFIFIIVVAIAWTLNAFYIYRKLIKKEKALTSHLSGTTEKQVAP